MSVNIEETVTGRGFKLIKFEDYYNTKCSIQESSLATEEAIWIGVDDASPKQMSPHKNGWTNYEIPEDVLLTTRMHLTREQVKELLPILQGFVDTGEI